MSQKKLDDVVREADLSGALFYGIGIYDPMDGDANPAVLKEMAKRTGGESFFPQNIQEVTTLCELTARDLRNQYMLVYAPESRDGDKDYHKVQVSVKDPLRRKLTVRTRTGLAVLRLGQISTWTKLALAPSLSATTICSSTTGPQIRLVQNFGAANTMTWGLPCAIASAMRT